MLSYPGVEVGSLGSSLLEAVEEEGCANEGTEPDNPDNNTSCDGRGI